MNLASPYMYVYTYSSECIYIYIRICALNISYISVHVRVCIYVYIEREYTTIIPRALMHEVRTGCLSSAVSAFFLSRNSFASRNPRNSTRKQVLATVYEPAPGWAAVRSLDLSIGVYEGHTNMRIVHVGSKAPDKGGNFQNHGLEDPGSLGPYD